jgi:hypothetical protein
MRVRAAGSDKPRSSTTWINGVMPPPTLLVAGLSTMLWLGVGWWRSARRAARTGSRRTHP